jgi:hypothetical protein
MSQSNLFGFMTEDVASHYINGVSGQRPRSSSLLVMSRQRAFECGQTIKARPDFPPRRAHATAEYWNARASLLPSLCKVDCSGKRLMVCWKIWGFWNSFSYRVGTALVVPWITRENILLMFLVYRWRTSVALNWHRSQLPFLIWVQNSAAT